MIQRDKSGNISTSTYSVAVNVEFLPGHTMKRIRLSPTYASIEAARVVQAHIQKTHPAAYVLYKTALSDQSAELFYQIAQDADTLIREQYPNQIAAVTEENQPETCA